MGNKEWTDEEVQNEIAEAVRIVREDRFEAFVRGRLSTTNDPNSGTNPPSPPAPNGNPDPPKKTKSLWWGDPE